jgi:TIR domain
MATLVISYSREDRPVVRAIVSLLNTALKDVDDAVFWDDDLEPGDFWFAQLERHIAIAPQLFVFWCAHSARSNEVWREYRCAFYRRKRVIPVLLDDTPLVAELAAIHGIDLRGTIAHKPRTPDPKSAARSEEPRKPRVYIPDYHDQRDSVSLPASATQSKELLDENAIPTAFARWLA